MKRIEEDQRAFCADLDQYIENTPLLSSEQMTGLFLRLKANDKKAETILFESNMRLVRAIVSKYSIGKKTSYLDLFQEGCIGLLKAIRTFQLEKGNTFGSYAYQLILNHLNFSLRHYGDDQLIRKPHAVVQKEKKYLLTEELLTQKLKRTPTVQELADAMLLSVQEVQTIVAGIADITSLDELLADLDKTDRPWRKRNIPAKEVDYDDAIMGQYYKEALEEAITRCNLTEKQQGILRDRYPLDSRDCLPNDKIGAKYGCTGEAIRQQEQRTLKRLHKYLKRKEGQYGSKGCL